MLRRSTKNGRSKKPARCIKCKQPNRKIWTIGQSILYTSIQPCSVLNTCFLHHLRRTGEIICKVNVNIAIAICSSTSMFMKVYEQRYVMLQCWLKYNDLNPCLVQLVLSTKNINWQVGSQLLSWHFHEFFCALLLIRHPSLTTAYNYRVFEKRIADFFFLHTYE